MDKRGLLKAVPMFAGLGRRDLDRVARRADQAEVAPGKVLARRGEPPGEVLVLLAGTARVELESGVGHLEAGDVCGAHACLEDQPQAATVVAQTPVSLGVIPRHAFNYLVDHIPELKERCGAPVDGRPWQCPSSWAARPGSGGQARVGQARTPHPE